MPRCSLSEPSTCPCGVGANRGSGRSFDKTGRTCDLEFVQSRSKRSDICAIMMPGNNLLWRAWKSMPVEARGSMSDLTIAKDQATKPAEDPALTVAVLVPCYNEEITIGKVVADFRSALPTATVYVYDNNSLDDTVKVAQKAGAVVRRELRQGKGNVVRRMFADVDADVYVLVDGDDTYDAAASAALVKRLIEERLDFINAMRVSTAKNAYRAGHRIRQLVADRPGPANLRAAIQRHVVGLQNSVPPICQIVSGDVERIWKPRPS